MNTAAAIAIALATNFLPNRKVEIPNQFLQAELVAELNSMVDDYKKIVTPDLSQNFKEIKVRSVQAVSVNDQFLNVKLNVRIREKNGLTGAVLYTSDGSARGKFRWGQVSNDKVCVAAGLQEFSCLNVTSVADVPHISSANEAEGARRAIMANFPKEVCALMRPNIVVSGTIIQEKTQGAHKHPPRTNKLIFTVALSNCSAQNVKVKYGTFDATAKAGVDYQAKSGELAIPSGTKTMKVEVPIIPRDGNQGARQMMFRLWSPVNAKILRDRAYGVILDTGQTVPGGPVPPPN